MAPSSRKPEARSPLSRAGDVMQQGVRVGQGIPRGRISLLGGTVPRLGGTGTPVPTHSSRPREVRALVVPPVPSVPPNPPHPQGSSCQGRRSVLSRDHHLVGPVPVSEACPHRRSADPRAGGAGPTLRCLDHEVECDPSVRTCSRLKTLPRPGVI